MVPPLSVEQTNRRPEGGKKPKSGFPTISIPVELVVVPELFGAPSAPKEIFEPEMLLFKAEMLVFLESGKFRSSKSEKTVRGVAKTGVRDSRARVLQPLSTFSAWRRVAPRPVSRNTTFYSRNASVSG